MSGIEWLSEAMRNGVPLPEEDVRTTVTTVDRNDPPAMADHAPEVNEHLTDPDTGGGLTTRQVGGYVTPSERYAPDVGNADDTGLFDIVNRQVSTSGTAAAREMAGQWGHGTMQVVDSIEPVVGDERPGMGDEYFEAYPDHTIQRGAGNYMAPPLAADPTTKAASVATGKANARQAADNPYAAWLTAQTGIS